MRNAAPYPVSDVKKTGENIRTLRIERGITVAEVQHYLGLSEPQAIYQWQRGHNLPSVDHLCALSRLFEVSIDDILVLSELTGKKNIIKNPCLKKHTTVPKALMLLWVA